MLMTTLANANKPKKRLGRRLALLLIPIVLIPFVLAAGVAFIHARNILQAQANEYLLSVTQGQSAMIEAWMTQREQQLMLGAQSLHLTQAFDQFLHPSSTEEDRQAVEEALHSLLTYQDAKLFAEALILSIEDQEIVAGSVSERQGQSFQLQTAQQLPSSGTIPVHDEPTLNITGLGFVSIAPLEMQAERANSYALIGISAKAEIEQLMKSLQMLSERRRGERIVRGKSMLAVQPETIISLAPYAITYDVITNPSHPIFPQPQTVEPGTLSYRDADGSPVLGAYKWLPGWDMAVMMELPEIEMFYGITTLAPYGAGMILGAVLLIAIVVLVITNRMLRPLGDLSIFADQVVKGQWEQRLPEDRSDEIGALSSALNSMAQEIGSLYQNLENQVQARTQQIRTASEVARAATAAPNLETVLRQAVTLIHERFGYDHVSIYLLDSQGKNVVLQDMAGKMAAERKQMGASLPVDESTMIGWVSVNNQPLLWPQAQNLNLSIHDTLLFGALSEAAVPLQFADRILGVLDVQSGEPEAFHQDDLHVMQTMADQLSAAIDNARLAQVSVTAAERARLVSEITSELSMLMEPEEVLRTAAQELHRALPEAEIQIQLTPLTQRPDHASQGSGDRV